MLFFLFCVSTLFAIPTYSVVVEKNPSCSPVLYTLDPRCTRSGERQTYRGSAFFWQGSLWTTHELVAGAGEISFSSKTGAITAEIQETAPRIGYARFTSLLSPNEPQASSPQKGEKVQCWGQQQGRTVSSAGEIQKKNVVVQYQQQHTPPLIQLSCPTELLATNQ